jgi:hypothetical protein
LGYLLGSSGTVRRRRLRKSSVANASAMAPLLLGRRVVELEQPVASELGGDPCALLAAPEALLVPPTLGAPASPAAPLELEATPATPLPAEPRPEEPPTEEPPTEEPPTEEPPTEEPPTEEPPTEELEPPRVDEPPCAAAPPAPGAPPVPPLPAPPVAAIGPTPTEKAIVWPEAPMS